MSCLHVDRPFSCKFPTENPKQQQKYRTVENIHTQHRRNYLEN